MEYSKIIAVTGMPGLYELLTAKPMAPLFVHWKITAPNLSLPVYITSLIWKVLKFIPFGIM